ncbi:MAG: hypothetical protein ABSE06_20330 [Anaerolineaceae bacterium]|jgi:hypothetical protein
MMKQEGLMALFLKRINIKWKIAIVFVVLFLLTTWVVYLRAPVSGEWHPGVTVSIGVDWKGTFRPAVFKMLSGESPNEQPAFNPPWIFILLLPFALLPPALGTAAIFTLGLFVPTWAAVRAGAKPLVAAAFTLSPLVLGNAQNGNIDWMVLLGVTLPPQFGLFLVLAKPQIGAGIALFWLVEAWRVGGVKQVTRIFGPVTVAFLLSFGLYGLWPLQSLELLRTASYNLTAWPYSIPFGFALLLYAIRRHSLKTATIASPLFSPYMMLHSWSIALFGILNTQLEFWFAWVFLWIMRFVYHAI